MTFRTISAALLLSLALPAAAQDDLGLDLSKPAPKKKDVKEAKEDELGLDLSTPAPKPKKEKKKKAPAADAASPAAAPAAAPDAPAAAPAADAKKPPAPADSRKPAAPAAADAKKPAAPADAKKPAAPADTKRPGAPAAAPAADAKKPGSGIDLGLKLDTPVAVGAPKDLELLDVPGFDDLDIKLLQDVSLCIFPFIKEDKLNEGSKGAGAAAKAAPQNLERIQKIFYDVAKSSPLLKDAIVIGKDAPVCGIEDTACISSLGNFSGCAAVLAGRSTREDNGFTLRARMVDTKKQKLMGKVNQVMATDDDRQVAAWAEGQACRALKVDCKATVTLDADRPDMRVLIDNRPLDRKPGALGPETLELSPGVYKVRVMIGQRNSREEVLAVRRGAKETIYARQLADGGIPLMLASSLQPGMVPPKSVDAHTGTRWTKPVGLVLAGLGVVAAGVGGYEYVHAKSVMDEANTAIAAQGGVPTSLETGKIGTANSANTLSKVAFGVGAGLIVVGAAFVFLF